MALTEHRLFITHNSTHLKKSMKTYIFQVCLQFYVTADSYSMSVADRKLSSAPPRG